jgi:hypothetical protein
MKRIALLVEGEYDGAAICNLLNRILNEKHAEYSGQLFFDSNSLRTGGLSAISGRRKVDNWTRYLQAVQRRKDLHGIIAVFDGDEDQFEGNRFCIFQAASTLATRAITVGAGQLFSLCIVILSQEYESLLIAAADSFEEFTGTSLPIDIESAPRGAKHWLRENLRGGYKPQADQLRLTQAIQDLSILRDRMRCYRRLENAVLELLTACISGQHFVSPILKSSTTPDSTSPM